jgi:UDP-glucuronate decarboxylase
MNLDSDKLGPYNLGNPIEFTVKELAETVIKLISSKSQIIYLPLPSDDPLRRKPDISKATNDFNWSPNIHLEEGLLKTINYFKKII